MAGFLHNMRAAAGREIGRMRRMPIYFALLVLLPLLSFGFFAALLGRGVARDIPVALFDEDRTPLSRTVARMIDDTPTVRIAYDVQQMDEAERLMREGKIAAIVQIPDFFEKNILSNRQTRIESYIAGTNISVNGLLSKDIQTAVTTFSAGIQLQLLTKQGLTERQAMAQLMPVRFDKHVLFNPYVNYAYYLTPSFLPMMLMIFTVMATVFALGAELKNGTSGEWIATAGGSVTAAFAGKLLPVTALLLLQALAMGWIVVGLVGVPLNGSFGLLLAGTVLFVAAYQSIALLFVALVANMRLALSLGGGYSVLAFTFSGLTFPIMAMWPAMRVVSRFFPFTYYTDVFVDQALRGAPVRCSLPDMGCMALFIVLPFLCLPRLRRICTDKKFWGRL